MHFRLDNARQMRLAKECGDLGRDLPRLRVGRLPAADHEIDVTFFLDRKPERARGAERVGDGEDTVGEMDATVGAECDARA